MRKRKHWGNVFQIRPKYALNEYQAQILSLTAERDRLAAELSELKERCRLGSFEYDSYTDPFAPTRGLMRPGGRYELPGEDFTTYKEIDV